MGSAKLRRLKAFRRSGAGLVREDHSLADPEKRKAVALDIGLDTDSMNEEKRKKFERF